MIAGDRARVIEVDPEDNVEIVTVIETDSCAPWCEKANGEIVCLSISQLEYCGEPVAVRFDFDGYGYKYLDNGSGSDWLTRIPSAEPLYSSAQRVSQQAIEIIQDCINMGFLVETVDSSPTHRDLVKRAQTIVSAQRAESERSV